jgi:hypothetical protein
MQDPANNKIIGSGDRQRIQNLNELARVDGTQQNYLQMLMDNSFSTRRGVRFEAFTAIPMKNVVFWHIKTHAEWCLLGCYAVWLL